MVEARRDRCPQFDRHEIAHGTQHHERVGVLGEELVDVGSTEESYGGPVAARIDADDDSSAPPPTGHHTRR